MSEFQYIRDPEEIYRHSFASIRAEADLDGLPKEMQDVAARLIHTCGMVDILDDLCWSDEAVRKGQSALNEGAVIFTDVEMVRSGIISRLLPAKNRINCTLNDERSAGHAKKIGNTRSAAALDFWGEDLEGAIVVIGNAPTALFHLLELIDAGAPRPALVLGFPVGFVGAAESKEALINNSCRVDYIALKGRRGGSAMAASALNAIAGSCQ